MWIGGHKSIAARRLVSILMIVAEDESLCAYE
jgi:hypothetical protein